MNSSDPKQENSKATVGVEVPEAAVEALGRRIASCGVEGWAKLNPGQREQYRSRAKAWFRESEGDSIIEPFSEAIRNEEREKVLGALEEPIHALASTIGRIHVALQNPRRNPSPLPDVEANVAAMGRLRAALASLPCETCGGDEEVEVEEMRGAQFVPVAKPCPDCSKPPQGPDETIEKLLSLPTHRRTEDGITFDTIDLVDVVNCLRPDLPERLLSSLPIDAMEEPPRTCFECGGPKPAAHPQFCADCGANYDSTDGD